MENVILTVFWCKIFLKQNLFNVFFSLVKHLVTFIKISVISVISGVSSDSGESTWPVFEDGALQK